jgi:hypothetical protein
LLLAGQAHYRAGNLRVACGPSLRGQSPPTQQLPVTFIGWAAPMGAAPKARMCSWHPGMQC